MHFHIVKMYEDKEVKTNVKNIVLSICDVKVFLTFTFTEYGTVLTTILPILFLYLNTVIMVRDMVHIHVFIWNKGNNNITELRAILQRESQNS
jgi:hypothetical protein